MPKSVGVVLAGGRSSRMLGPDKASAELDGEPLAARAARRLATQVETVALNVNAEPERFTAIGLTLLADALPGYLGPMAGIATALRWADSLGAERCVTVAVDTPFFPETLVRRFDEAALPGEIVLASSDDRVHPVFGSWPIAVRPQMEAFLASGEIASVLAFARARPHRIVDFPLLETRNGTVDPFFNINAPEDLERARHIVQSIGST